MWKPDSNGLTILMLLVYNACTAETRALEYILSSHSRRGEAIDYQATPPDNSVLLLFYEQMLKCMRGESSTKLVSTNAKFASRIGATSLHFAVLGARWHSSLASSSVFTVNQCFVV